MAPYGSQLDPIWIQMDPRWIHLDFSRGCRCTARAADVQQELQACAAGAAGMCSRGCRCTARAADVQQGLQMYSRGCRYAAGAADVVTAGAAADVVTAGAADVQQGLQACAQEGFRHVPNQVSGMWAALLQAWLRLSGGENFYLEHQR